jgi:hypothetical protein
LSSLWASTALGGESTRGRPSPEEALAQLLAKHKQNEKKYEALVAKIDKAVRAALAATPMSGPDGAPARTLSAHPWVKFVDQLTAEVKSELKSGGAKPAEASALLARYPWSKDLEFVEGLQYGSDRPVPTHENGYVALGALPDPPPGFPELGVNQYLYGLHEIVGWRACVDQKKTLLFRPRTASDPSPGIETALPPWEAIRVYLSGSLPEVSLYAIPRLTHKLHARLAERRLVDGKPAALDELLALLDSRWNAFTFQTPYAKARTAIALPVGWLIADRKSFVYRFPLGMQLSSSGDIPFVSILTIQKYAQIFRDQTLDAHDLIARSPDGAAATDAFWQDCVYVSRYRALIETFVRAILAPGFAFPEAMEPYDFPGGALPAERSAAAEIDVSRKQALVLWAFREMDPTAVADFLHENLLDLEVNRYPKNASLHTEFAYAVRKRYSEMFATIQGRIAREPQGDFAHLFSPNATYLDTTTPAKTGTLVHSFQQFHEPVSEAIREAAYAVVMAELK